MAETPSSPSKSQKMHKPADWTELHEVCGKLLRDSGGRKVLLCRADEGEILSHAGAAGFLDDSASDALAGLVADLAFALADGTGVVEEASLKLGADRGATGVLVGPHAILVVLFDGTTSADRVRAKMRRAAELLSRLLESAPARLS